MFALASLLTWAHNYISNFWRSPAHTTRADRTGRFSADGIAADTAA